MKTRLNFDWIYNIWRESNLTENETLMASSMICAEQEYINQILGESDIVFIEGLKKAE